MRFRVKRGGPAGRFIFDREVKPASETAAARPPKAADLDNPYSRYYGTARSREDLLRRNSPGHLR